MFRRASSSCVVAALSVTLLGCTATPDGQPHSAATGPQPAATATTPATAAPEPPSRPFVIIEDAAQPVARTRDGCVVLEVIRQWHTLKYRPGTGAQCPSFDAAQPMLREMVQALAAAGLLSEVTSFDVSRHYSAFFQRLAAAAASSPDWDSRLGKPKQGTPNAFVVATSANADAFYPEVKALFADTGLDPELRSVEKVLVLPAAETPYAAQLSAAGVKSDARLPHDCIVVFHLKSTAAAQ